MSPFKSALVVAQMAQELLLKPEVNSSNPVIDPFKVNLGTVFSNSTDLNRKLGNKVQWNKTKFKESTSDAYESQDEKCYVAKLEIFGNSDPRLNSVFTRPVWQQCD